MASTSRNPLTLTVVVQTSIIMLNFCFVECAGVTCLNFGHSCWGAHGKRSDVQDASGLRVLAAKALLSEFPQNGIASSSKAQWLLSRLVAGQPVLPDKYRVRWNNIPKGKTYVPAKWERDTTSTDNENLESIRVPIDNANEKKVNNAKGTMCSTNEKPEKNIAEILLVSPDEYEKPIKNLQNFDILKFLNMRNGKME
ncbi:PREDICTED: uncharacterized protein LOC106744967 isoform X2 [Dinoponera quadriceps]|uniref:Uncharacterized protein LOC106744967 isoform X2 n=1 Tax=Dinoponera quadriceps TaxID=609295 RepID=A0A6P3XBL2_DINQU|nr:PREDICTED: uncharacterized protein LOC106744967 isoform X2 [Dinoponera quadriceps]